MRDPLLAFALATVPDVEGGRRLHGLEGLEDDEVARVMAHKRRERTGDTDRPPHHLRRVALISMVRRRGGHLEVASLGDTDTAEAGLLRVFFGEIGQDGPLLVTWGGRRSHLPVLRYRTLLQGIPGARCWTDENHLDLQEAVAGGEADACAALAEIATLTGLAGQAEADPQAIWEQWQAGDLSQVRAGCESRAVQIYVLYLRAELARGRLTPDDYTAESRALDRHLRASGRPHLLAFAAARQSA
jgi:predicted PolB exonuclease-like 3'-5' exonuclease